MERLLCALLAPALGETLAGRRVSKSLPEVAELRGVLQPCRMRFAGWVPKVYAAARWDTEALARRLSVVCLTEYGGKMSFPFRYPIYYQPSYVTPCNISFVLAMIFKE